MPINDNFDLILAIPCETVKSKKKTPIKDLDVLSLESIDDSITIDGTNLPVKNAAHDNKSTLPKLAQTFCEQIQEHGEYELIFNDQNTKIKTGRKPLVFGQIILYTDNKNSKFIPECCYNFFCVISELTINKDSYSKNNAFNTMYIVVPDINYNDLTLMIDQSFELWCNINGNADEKIFLMDYLNDIGYKYFGKIYRIAFSDYNQFKTITENEKNYTKVFNILAAETYKEEFCHQIELSESTNEYLLSYRGGDAKNIMLSKKEKFFDDYNMYSSYRAYASLYSYYYIINEEDKDIFCKRIEPDDDDEGFSSEANILFVLETEIFKISAGLTLSNRINEQINNPNMREIQEMFKCFINTRPLFEKLNYCYLGAQKEANFIYQQFQISDILTDYDRKRELLKNYCEVTTSITENNNSKILSCVGILFTFSAGLEWLKSMSHTLFDDEENIQWSIDFVIPVVVFLVIVGIIVKIIGPIKYFKRLIKSRFEGE